MLCLLAQMEPPAAVQTNRNIRGLPVWTFAMAGCWSNPMRWSVPELDERVVKQEFDSALWSRHWLLWHDRHYSHQEGTDSSLTKEKPSRYSAIQVLSPTASILEAWQNPVADRHLNYALHFNRAEINQKLSFRHPEVYGDASEVQRIVREQSKRVVGQQPSFSFDFNSCTGQAVGVPQEGTDGDGNSASSLWCSIRHLFTKDIPRGQQPTGQEHGFSIVAVTVAVLNLLTSSVSILAALAIAVLKYLIRCE